MSLPVGISPMIASTITSGSAFEVAVQSVNTNPIFIGLMMLTMNLGARFLSLEITKSQEQLLQHPYFRRFLIFVIFFIATRNVVTAFWMSIIVILCIGYLFNENSGLCIWKGGAEGSKCAAMEGFTEMPPMVPITDILTPEERDILNKLKEKEQRMQGQRMQGQHGMKPVVTRSDVAAAAGAETVSPVNKYTTAMKAIRQVSS